MFARYDYVLNREKAYALKEYCILHSLGWLSKDLKFIDNDEKPYVLEQVSVDTVNNGQRTGLYEFLKNII